MNQVETTRKNRSKRTNKNDIKITQINKCDD